MPKGHYIFALSALLTTCQARGWLTAVSGAEAEPPLSFEIPGDFHSRQSDPDVILQDDFDRYSWDVLIALSWPARADGNPDESLMIGEAGAHGVVWESWKSVDDIFRAGGEVPGPWQTAPSVPSYLVDKQADLKEIDPPDSWQGRAIDELVARKDVKYLTYIAKGHSWSHTSIQAFNSGPLIDRHGKYARFEIRVNRPMFEYIADNELFHVDGQEVFKRDIVFPCGYFKLDDKGNPLKDKFNRPITERVGAIVVKAAWKVLTDEERESGRFYVRRGYLDTRLPERKANVEWVGLVGFHVVHKSENVIQWTWSTFEHVDNCPTEGASVRRSYSFFSPSSKLEINTPPDRPWDASIVEEDARRSKIVRMTPITEAGAAINREYHDHLKGINPKTVWQYYDLVSTQWPTRPAPARARGDDNHCNVLKIAPADIVGDPAPVFLANTTLESYIQKQVPNSSSSCMECHANATGRNGRFADFTYILERAKKRGERDE